MKTICSDADKIPCFGIKRRIIGPEGYLAQVSPKSSTEQKLSSWIWGLHLFGLTQGGTIKAKSSPGLAAWDGDTFSRS